MVNPCIHCRFTVGIELPLSSPSMEFQHISCRKRVAGRIQWARQHQWREMGIWLVRMKDLDPKWRLTFSSADAAQPTEFPLNSSSSLFFTLDSSIYSLLAPHLISSPLSIRRNWCFCHSVSTSHSSSHSILPVQPCQIQHLLFKPLTFPSFRDLHKLVC